MDRHMLPRPWRAPQFRDQHWLSIAAFHSAVYASFFGSAKMYVAASFSVMSGLPFGAGIRSSKGRDQVMPLRLDLLLPRRATIFKALSGRGHWLIFCFFCNVISPHKQGSFDLSRTRLAFFRDLPD